MFNTEAEVQFFIVAIGEIKDKFDLQLEKTQELLERVECIDNSLDTIIDARGVNEQSDADFRENVLEWLRRLHQQGGTA